MNATAPAAPMAEAVPQRRALLYFATATLIGLTQGLGQGFVTANIPQVAGDLGVSTTDASWLMAAYMIPRASLPLMLVKIRTQYGLRRFAEFGIVMFVLTSFAAIWIGDLRSAIVVQFLSGAAAAPLSTLAFLYMLEPLSPQSKMRFGMPMVLVVIMIGPNLARVISPSLIGDGGLLEVHLMALGLALLSLVAIYRLPLQPVPHERVIKPLDLLSFALIAAGFSCLTIAAVQGPLHWWTAQAWIGWLLAWGIGALTLAVVIELCREAPLVDFRWLATPEMLHLTIALLLFRLVLSEQSAGAPRMFQLLGVAPSQLVGLFSVISIASLMGGLACVAWMKATREAAFHSVALLLIAAGAWMDSHSTIDTRPAQMLISQAMIGFAGMLFMPPATLMGLMAALKKGPSYILSFIVVFLATQSLGGAIGSGMFTTLINYRQAFHQHVLVEQLSPTQTTTMAALSQRAAALATQHPDMVANHQQASVQLMQVVNDQAFVMAYNDAYYLTSLIASGAFSLLVLHVLRNALWRRLDRNTSASADTGLVSPSPQEAPTT